MIKRIFYLIAAAILAVPLFFHGCDDNPAKPKPQNEEVNIWQTRAAWTYASRPAVIDSTHPRAYLGWYNLFLDYEVNSKWSTPPPPYIDLTPTFWLSFSPAAVDRRLGEYAPGLEISNSSLSWGGIMRHIPEDATEIDDAEYLELRILGDGVILHIDLGDISEDINGNNELDNEDIPVSGVYNNVYDQGEDIGLDGFPDSLEPGYDPISNSDPNGDNWNYYYAEDFSHINGTEGNALDPESKGKPDTEDLNYNRSLDKQNYYVSYKLDLTMADNYCPFYLHGTAFNGWRTFVIPLRDAEAVDTGVGGPYFFWSHPNYARLWIESPSGDSTTIAIAEFKFTKNQNYEESNKPPTTPAIDTNYGTPPDHSINQPIGPALAWSCSDPDGDSLLYSIHFGISTPPPQVATDITSRRYYPGALDFNTKYYWQIFAYDEYDAMVASPIWEFTTGATCPVWTTKAVMSSAKSPACAAELDGLIYVLGDRLSPTFEVYDPSNNQWTTLPYMPTDRSNYTMAAADGRIYVIGGDTLNNDYMSKATGLVEVFNPATNSWTSKAQMPTPRYSLSAATWDGKIYVAGGWDMNASVPVSQAFEMYDPVANQWTSLSPMPTGRNMLTLSAISGKIYACGGFDGSSPLNVTEEYDPIIDSWTSRAPMPTSKILAASVVIYDCLYIFGGADNMTAYNSVERYDPSLNLWSTMTSMPTARYDAGAAAASGKAYIAGGFNTDVLNIMEEYNPACDTAGPSIDVARMIIGATIRINPITRLIE